MIPIKINQSTIPRIRAHSTNPTHFGPAQSNLAGARQTPAQAETPLRDSQTEKHPPTPFRQQWTKQSKHQIHHQRQRRHQQSKPSSASTHPSRSSQMSQILCVVCCCCRGCRVVVVVVVVDVADVAVVAGCCCCCLLWLVLTLSFIMCMSTT